MNKKKIFMIGFMILVVGIITIAMIITDCGENTVRDKTTSTNSSSFDKSILETNSSKTIKNLEVPINDKWEVENDKDDSIYENDYCYTVDGNNGYIFMWVRSQKSDISLESSKDYFDNDSDYKNKHSEIFELFDDIDALDTSYLDSSSDNYSHSVEFIVDGEDYEIEFYGDKSLKKYIETLYNNVIGSNLVIHYQSVEETTTTTEETTIEDYDSDDYDYEEETTKPKKDTLVYSDSNVNIYFHDVTTEFDDTYVNFNVKNKINKKLEFQADTITLDGISYNNIVMSDPVAPKSTGVISAHVEKAPYKQPQKVGGELHYFDEVIGKSIDKKISFVNIKVK